jgi:Mrp family chromosome partitioning ATPase
MNLTTPQDSNHTHKIIAVMSGKGGVGKSVVAGLLAGALQRRGLRAGLLDGDLISPSLVKLFGVEIQLSINEQGIIEPLTSQSGIQLMSMHVFQQSEEEPLIWRGPMVSSAFKQLYSETGWGALDYLIIDAPTGTSDVPMTILHSVPLDGVILVSTPQKLAARITQRCINMVQQYNKPILGIVENMAFFMAPDGEYHALFGPGCSSDLTSTTAFPLLAQLPLDPQLTALCDTGQLEAYHTEAVKHMTERLIAILQTKERKPQDEATA